MQCCILSICNKYSTMDPGSLITQGLLGAAQAIISSVSVYCSLYAQIKAYNRACMSELSHNRKSIWLQKILPHKAGLEFLKKVKKITKSIQKFT